MFRCTAVFSEFLAQSLPGNVAELGGSLPPRRVLEKHVRSSPDREPFQGTGHITQLTPEVSLERLISLSD